MLDVKVTGDLEAWAREAAKAATRATEESVGATTREVHADAKARWPVRRPDRPANHPRGYSRDRLAQTVGMDENGVFGKVSNDSGYAYFVRSSRFELPPGSPGVRTSKDGKRHAWTALVREPAERKSVGLRDRLKDAIVRAIEGVR